jgi:hypothetical protein
MSLIRLLPLLEEKYVLGLPFTNRGISGATFQPVIFNVQTLQESGVRTIGEPTQFLYGLNPNLLSRPVLNKKPLGRTT